MLMLSTVFTKFLRNSCEKLILSSFLNFESTKINQKADVEKEELSEPGRQSGEEVGKG